MRTIIAGSRSASLADVQAAMYACRFSDAITVALSGCSEGADDHGESWARSHGIPVERHPADWDTHGKAAGPIRNSEMAQAAAALVAVWDGKSPGTRDMIAKARRRGLVTFVHRIDR